MNAASESINGKEAESLAERTHIELVRRHEILCAELQRMRQENNVLAMRLDHASRGREADRESRRAALNLMEDAVDARRVALLENAERRRVEQELLEASQRKDEFLATLAHELRNPLAPIRNSLQILGLPGIDGPTLERIHEVLERQVHHMVRLVNDLMEVSRVTQGRIELRKERVELAVLVNNAVEMSTELIQTNRHRLTIDLPTEPLFLDVDPVRISQVIANLLNNAARYTEEGGDIRLVARRDSSWVIISVFDNGIGIPKEMLLKVFDLFTQLDHSYGGSRTGLGIGLTLVRKLVEEHGGTVEAKSEGRGRGSQFVVRLALAAEEFGKDRPGSKGDLPATIDTRRILIVDDNSDAADSLALLLKQLGAETRTANDGPAALEILQSYHPSVVLLDIGMPGMNGHEVARHVRQMSEGQNMTLIALTGWGQEEDRLRCKESGFDHHLVKPLELEDLREILATLPSEPPSC